MTFGELPSYSITLWNVSALGSVERWISTMVLVQHPLSERQCATGKREALKNLRMLALFLIDCDLGQVIEVSTLFFLPAKWGL